MGNMNIKLQFSNNAITYDKYNLIQRRVIQQLLNNTVPKPKKILDLGCGTGSLYNSINWQFNNFIAVDFSKEMLSLHPHEHSVKCIVGDFNNRSLFDNLGQYSIDRIFSASSLQWATDLEATFKYIKSLNVPVSFAIFTANTFETLFATANLQPILRTVDEVSSLANQYFDAHYETVHYTLSFNSTLDMLRYIKASGVSAGRNALDYKSMKKLIHNYPLDYLEFEVLFIIE